MKTIAVAPVVLTMLCVGSASAQKKEPGRSKKAKAAEWIQLFNRKDLSGWNVQRKEPPRGRLTKETIERLRASWKVKDGILVASGTASCIYYERRRFADFHLRLEARGSAGHGSKVNVRAPHLDEYNLAGYPAGYGFIVNGAANFTGDLDRLPRRVKEKLVKPDEWFTLEVIARGDRFVVKVNRKTTLDFTDAKKKLFNGDPKNAVGKGYVALSIVGAAGETRFRKIEIKELSGDSKSPNKK